MTFGRLLRASAVGLALLHAGDAWAGVDRSSRKWVSDVVSRITAADRDDTAGSRNRGAVTIRVRIAADGTIVDVGIDDSSGYPDRDERAIRAARAAGPFGPPPEKLLILEGFIELSFPLQPGGKAVR